MKIKKLGLGALSAAAFTALGFATLASPASADVNSMTLSDTTIQIDQSVTLTTVLDTSVMVGDQISLTVDSLVGGGEATFDINDADALSCLLNPVDLGDDGAVGGAGDDEDSATLNCGGETVDIETLTAVSEDEISDGTFEVKVSGTESGQIVIYGQQEETAVASANALVLGTSASGDVDELEASAPSSVSASGDQEVTVTITALDDEGDAVPGEVIEVEVNSGDVDGIADGDTDTTDSDGEASFTFTVEDSEDTGVSLTFFAPTGAVIPPNVDVTIVVAGAADSVEITAEESVETGSVSDVSAEVLDEDGNPVPNAAIDFLASNGNIVACDEETDGNGIAECTLVAPSAAGTVQITAVAAGAAGTATVTVTQGDSGEPGDGSLTTPNFGSGNVGSAVFAGGSIEQLASAVQAAGGTGVWVQSDDGNWYRYTVGATGSTAFVNNAFNAEFTGGFPGATAVIVVK